MFSHTCGHCACVWCVFCRVAQSRQAPLGLWRNLALQCDSAGHPVTHFPLSQQQQLPTLLLLDNAAGKAPARPAPRGTSCTHKAARREGKAVRSFGGCRKTHKHPPDSFAHTHPLKHPHRPLTHILAPSNTHTPSKASSHTPALTLEIFSPTTPRQPPLSPNPHPRLTLILIPSLSPSPASSTSPPLRPGWRT